MTIEYQPGMALALYVKDTGSLDTYAVYVNGGIVEEVADQQVRRFPIDPPTSDLAIVVQFGGGDGGLSGIFDEAGGKKVKLAGQSGLSHAYLIRPRKAS